MKSTKERLGDLEKEVASIKFRIKEANCVPTNYKYIALKEQLQLLSEKAKDATPAEIPAIAQSVLAICMNIVG